MNIFDILKEAKSPSNQQNKTIRVYTSNSTDYTEDTDVDTTGNEIDVSPDNNQDTSSDYTEEIEEIEPREDNNEETTDENNESDYADNIDSAPDDESTDYTEDVNSDENPPDDNEGFVPEENVEEQTPEEKLENVQNSELLETTINLYYSILGICTKLDSITHPSVLANKITAQVKQNFNTLCEYIYKFITTQFNNNPYIKNLYIYNYILESYKINIEMLKKLSIFK